MNKCGDKKRIECVRLRDEERLTYREIAERIGVSHQRVSQILGQQDVKYFRTHSGYVYPNIERWMNDNKISLNELSRRTSGSSRLAMHWSAFLRGVIDVPKRDIDKLLSVTGLTYETAFAKAV